MGMTTLLLFILVVLFLSVDSAPIHFRTLQLSSARDSGVRPMDRDSSGNAQSRDQVHGQESTTRDNIEEASKRGDKAKQRADQARLFASMNNMDPDKAEEVAAEISKIDPTTH